MNQGHIPVLLDDVMDALAPHDGGHYIDGTFGGGGYSQALLARADCRVLGIDRDPDAIARGESLRAASGGRLTLAQGRFSELEQLLHATGETGSDGVVFDLGVSSYQLDDTARGFSFRGDAGLDMRMERAGLSAADVVNETDETDLANILFQLGEERHSRRVARAIVAARPLTRTTELADVVAKALGPAAARQKIHPATRTFQALRLHVNDELGELARGLEAAERVLRPRGRLAVVSFHSLEDRIVKQFFAERCGRLPAGSRHAPSRQPERAPSFGLLATRPRMSGNAEIARNPRSRSARLRAAERLAA
ncbi:MAG TPA: 16S rRNA (cytosine(1402)-N(4))-methyltransferase RsmH [Rhizomicrobium sp.]|jgi:16S rRNA (cytosine1402-N4)-methyltransferase